MVYVSLDAKYEFTTGEFDFVSKDTVALQMDSYTSVRTMNRLRDYLQLWIKNAPDTSKKTIVVNVGSREVFRETSKSMPVNTILDAMTALRKEYYRQMELGSPGRPRKVS